MQSFRDKMALTLGCNKYTDFDQAAKVWMERDVFGMREVLYAQ
jgi:hypothetical protein